MAAQPQAGTRRPIRHRFGHHRPGAGQARGGRGPGLRPGDSRVVRFHHDLPAEWVEYILWDARIEFTGLRKARKSRPWRVARFKKKEGKWVPLSQPPVRLDRDRSYTDLGEWLELSIKRILTCLGPAAAIDIFSSLYSTLDPWDALRHRDIFEAIERLCGQPRGRGKLKVFPPQGGRRLTKLRLTPAARAVRICPMRGRAGGKAPPLQSKGKRMKHVHYKEVEAVQVAEAGAESCRVRWLISNEDGAPNFYMRRFELEPGGRTPRHAHPWEHEVYVLEGEGTLLRMSGDEPFRPGDVVFVPSGEVHSFTAGPGASVAFLCLIPKEGKPG